MPFDGEFASYGPLSRVLRNPRVQNVIARCRRNEISSDTDRPQIAIAEARPSNFLPDLVLAIDGGYQEVPVDNGYPSAQLACVTAAAVLIDVQKQRELDQQRPVNPRDFRQTQGATSIDCALPGCNVILDEPTPKGSFRRQLFEASAQSAILTGAETLLATYEALLRHKPTTRPPECPYGESCASPDNEGNPRRFNPSAGESRCPCSEARPVFSTDALRMHEGFNPHGSSGAMYMEVMQVWERLWLINFLRGLESQGLLPNHRPLAVIMDGPLAAFGHPAWLSQAISRELSRLNEVARQGGSDLLIVGVEKAGAFVDHFAALDSVDRLTQRPRVAPQTAMLLSNAYIREHIVISDGKPYGQDTYFGRKFFYKTVAGARIVGTLPFLRAADRDLDSTSADHFPRLTDAMSLLDTVFSVRFPNAVGPLVAAHAEAAIPLNAGRRAFEQLVAHLRA